jgi:hypothetical protein
MMGPGKHDALCTYVREQLQMGDIGGVMLIVFAPGQGNGFSCQADFQTTMMMPEILEAVAAQIREDRKGIGQ